MKICSKCKAEKHNEQFIRHKYCADGLRPECRSCTAEYRREYRKLNAEKLKIKADAYRSENSEKCRQLSYAWKIANPERAKELVNSWRSKNNEKVNFYSSSWRKSNKEKANAATAAWRKINPEKASIHARNRRSRKNNAEGNHAAKDVLAIFEAQRGLCANCGNKLFKSGGKKYHVDHIMPLALGGSNWPSNLQCLCPACNLSKGAKHPAQWAKQQGKLI